VSEAERLRLEMKSKIVEEIKSQRREEDSMKSGGLGFDIDKSNPIFETEKSPKSHNSIRSELVVAENKNPKGCHKGQQGLLGDSCVSEEGLARDDSIVKAYMRFPKQKTNSDERNLANSK
jgi:hypothetical protein